MHQHDRAQTKEGLYAPEHLGDRVASPVFGVGAPGGELEAKILRNLLSPGCTYAPRRAPEPRFYIEASEGLDSLTRVGLDLAAGAARVAHVLCAVKLDFVSRVERIGDQLTMLEGERGDHEEGRASANVVESVEYSRRPRGIRTVIEGQRSPRGDARCPPYSLDDPSPFVASGNMFQP
jgi:hypothetical protein